MNYHSLTELRDEVIKCRRCPRLVEFRENVPTRKSFENENYWRRPVPGYGDPNAWLLVTGLAPSAHGGNRTGRLFTGDKSSQFLMKALYDVGLASQPESESLHDGLRLNGCFMTAVVKCVPPHDKPTQQEIINCSGYYCSELQLLKNVTHVLALGKMAFDAFFLASREKVSPRPKFHFGQRCALPQMPILYASYHPSPQNTNTGVLTHHMFVGLLNQILSDRKIRGSCPPSM